MNYNLNSNTKNTNESSDTQNVNKEPIVYIYNSHQSEAYNDSSDTVIKAARILKNVLEEKGVPTIFEEADILEFMRINNYDHSKSYVASSYYIKDALLKNKNLKLLIDFHRDSVSKNSSTVEIDGKSYAKVLFVVGLEHDNYQDNLTLANTLNDMINSKYKGLSRGIMQKKGAGVNGIYNQNLSPNMILLEFGGAENTIEEVENSINAIANIIKEYLGV